MDQILTAISSKYGATKTSSPSENSNVSKNGEILSPLNMIIIKAEAERVSVFAERYNISMVPTFLLLTKKVQQNEDESDTKVLNAGKDSDDSSFEQLDLIEGVKTNELVKAIEKQLNDLKSKAVLKMANGLNYSNYDLAMNEVDTQARIVKGLEQDQLKLKLKELVNASKTMLFIKGTLDDPRCKYTRELLDLFKAEKSLSFGSYNVLADREENKQVREGLKEFSGWNTYPQVFHNGKLVGGLDSIKELRQKNSDSIAQGFAKLDEEYLKERSLEDACHISKSVNEAKGSEVTKEVTDDLNARLKSLISRSEVMLFMKGSPNEPRCGFSDRIVRLLKDQEVTFGSFDILTDEAVRQGLKIFSNWPTFPQLYVRGELVGGLDIVQEMAAEGALKEQLGLTGENEKENLNKRLKALIESNKVMLFMKGTPNEPRCGFSRQVVQILNEEGCQFGSFDILSDEDVRQGLKTYSNWPTYPQVYVKGELVGGLDVLKEMRDDGELRDALDL